MNGFALLWSKILESSLWVQESKETRLVWVTILAMKNVDGIVQASVVGLADRAKVTPDECKAALKVLLSPDPNDTSKVEEGRRLREIPGGWQVVNNDLYRFSTEAKREFWRQTKAEQRRRSKLRPGEEGISMREIITKRVNEDPITKADLKALGKKKNHKPLTTVEKEYDLDDTGYSHE